MAGRCALLLGVLALAALAAASADTGGPARPAKPEPPGSKAQCMARGGQWILYPMGQFHFCVIRTGDRGKPCADDGECQGDCVPADRPSRLPGVCAPTLPMPGGCPKHLVNGKLIEEPCI